MSLNDVVHKILRLRKQLLAKLNDDNNELVDIYEKLLKWRTDIIHQLDEFIDNTYKDVEKKYVDNVHQQISDLNTLYVNCGSNQKDHSSKPDYSQLLDNLNKIQSSSPSPIIVQKEIDFKQYFQLKTDHLISLYDSLLSISKPNHFNLSSYELISRIQTQSNLRSLFATHDSLLIYYDNLASNPIIHLLDLQNYIEQLNNEASYLKLRIPCKQFQDKVMHMDYSAYLQAFLIGTSAKLFTLKVSTAQKNYSLNESFDMINWKSLGILQKFAFHPTISNLSYVLVNCHSQYRLIQTDLSRNFILLKHWKYPKYDTYERGLSSANDCHQTDYNYQLKAINDFALGKDLLIFLVTCQTNNTPAHIFYELHIRSLEVRLQHRLRLDTSSLPLRIYLVPNESSATLDHNEQCMIFFQKSKIVSVFDIRPKNESNPVQMTNEISLDDEAEAIGFIDNDLSVVFIRTPFHFVIYKLPNKTISKVR